MCHGTPAIEKPRANAFEEKNFMRTSIVICGVLALMAGSQSSTCLSQQSEATGQLIVLVKDTDGKSIPNATVTVFRWTGKMEPLGLPKHTGSDGKTTITNLPPGETLYVSVVADGLAPTEQHVELGQGELRDLKFTLKPSIECWIRLRDPDGRPVENAKFQRLDFVDADGRQVAVTESTASSLGVELQESDAEGRLNLPPVFDGAKISVWISHPDWRLTKIDDLIARRGELRSVAVQAGVRVQISLTPHGIDSKDLEGLPVEIRMFPADGGSGSEHTVLRKVDVANGSISFTVSPVRYESLFLLADHHYFTPFLDSGLMKEEPALDLRDGETLNHAVVVRHAKKVRGKIVAPDKQPLAKVYVRSRISNLGPEGLVGNRPSEQWSPGGDCETDESGRFEVDAAVGLVAVEAFLDGYFRSPSKFEFQVSSEVTELPDIQLTPLPTIRGKVVTAAGQPVAGAITCFRSTGRGADSTVSLTDESGRFELPVSRIPMSQDLDGLQTTIFVLALDPESGNAGRAEIDLTNSSSVADMQVTLKPQETEWILNPLADQPFGLRSEAETAARRKLHAERAISFPAGVTGEPAPDLSNGTWLNTDARSLKDLKGQFVLLDFWFIGCGPCHADLPTVKATYDAFRERGCTVVSVHTKSQSPESVASYAKEHGMDFPIVVDNTDGTLLDDYSKLGVYSFPSYLLIGPDSRIVINDNMADPDRPSLRLKKIEAVFHALKTRKN